MILFATTLNTSSTMQNLPKFPTTGMSTAPSSPPSSFASYAAAQASFDGATPPATHMTAAPSHCTRTSGMIRPVCGGGASAEADE
jgi:hypothetical protein